MTTEPDLNNQLLEAANRVASARAADKDAFWAGAAVAGIAAYVISETGNLGEAWALLAIIVPAALVYRIAKIVFYRMRGLGTLPLFGNLLPSTVSAPQGGAGGSGAPANTAPSPAEDQPRSASVARLPFTRTPSDAEVVLGDLIAVETLRAGRSGTPHDDLPLGVLMVTSAGLAFLPEARGQLENMLGDLPGAIVGELAGELLPPVGQIQAVNDIFELYQTPPPLVAWMDTALRQKHAFVIAWGDLVGVFASRASLLLERRTNETESSFTLLMDGTPLVSVLMQRRILTDLRETVMEFILRPKAADMLPAVEAELAGASPGLDAAELQTQARQETAQRTMRWFSETSPPMEALVKEKMQPALEGYAQLPRIVANQPWLFAAGESETVH